MTGEPSLGGTPGASHGSMSPFSPTWEKSSARRAKNHPFRPQRWCLLSRRHPSAGMENGLHEEEGPGAKQTNEEAVE